MYVMVYFHCQNISLCTVSVLQVFLDFLRVQVRWDSLILCMSDDGENKVLKGKKPQQKQQQQNMLKIERKT